MLSASIKLTDEQVQELQVLFTEVSAAARLTKSSGKERRYAVLGQAFAPDDDTAMGFAGRATFYLLNANQYKVVNAAIKQSIEMERSEVGTGD